MLLMWYLAMNCLVIPYHIQSLYGNSCESYSLSFQSGTPAARMKKVPSTVVKKRSRELTTVFESFTPYNGMEGRVERIWVTEIATDGIHLV